jgi:hypothetical protein
MPFDYVTGDRTTTIPNTLSVDVVATRRGEKITTTVHLGQGGDGLSWFTNCGTPLASAN